MDRTKTSRQIGRIAALALFFCTVAYAITLVVGLVSLKSPQDPIKDPYFTLMEVLIFIMAPLLVIVMVAVHAYAAREDKVYSLIALAFMIMQWRFSKRSTPYDRPYLKSGIIKERIDTNVYTHRLRKQARINPGNRGAYRRETAADGEES